LKNILATLVHDSGGNWLELLPQVIYAYRTAYHSSLDDSPFFLLYGRDPRNPIGLTNSELFTEESHEFREVHLARTKLARELVQKSLKQAALKARQTFNKTAKEHTTLQGLVLRETNIQEREKNHPLKLRTKWTGPYRILRQVAPLTYEIQRIGSQDVWRAHARTLKPYYARSATPFFNDLEVDSDEERLAEDLEVSKIIATKWDKQLKEPLYQVRWKQFTAKSDSWEPLGSILSQARSALQDFVTRKSRTSLTKSRPRK
jgi:Chromo (CHRromatin Organisation MOdifier) domain